MEYDQSCSQFQVVLDAWTNQEYNQIQENRRLLKKASTSISKEADGFIKKAIDNTVDDWKLGNIPLVGKNFGRLASTGEKQVRPKNSFVHLC